ncbi:uncharacterized protein Z518_07000 [Rhinocladiella mackenziei CBS 650.93]|uniref:Nitrate/nitrite transporter n=1 Tax=Rhinocladiella mackenziei CBS 650.93 TaxID=1442369 RepID=A0A0D2GZ63_9EURO|nr:uncharacterized protein Z518_07000 [Rhinocladiella mackenziei CBS 650.93]KIX03448.1 hypothetical protein Z518_07000 [Rhinocladiella mackenziei CBS 650.93]
MIPISILWRAPEVNPVNQKARSIPVLNPFDKYGRVFFFSWFGFFIAFWSWYAFPPLMTVTIKKDLNMSTVDVANSNIAALTATLLVRFVAGPCCDRFGARWTFIGTLLLGSIPTALSGTVSSVAGLITIRFFVGILGGTFVPCQVWSTAFFDKNVVGTSNALIGGWGNSGGGITYFLMPVIFNSLVNHQGLSEHVAWRVAFIVPFILIVATALGMTLFCPDTPTGKWSERHLHTSQLLSSHGLSITTDEKGISHEPSGSSTPNRDMEKVDSKGATAPTSHNPEAHLSSQEMLDIARGEVIQKPTFKEALNVIFSLQALFHCATYFCSFGGELAINSYLGAYYLKNFPELGQTGSGRWASMFGLLNVVTRPLGGVVADILYRYTKSTWVKKIWILFVGVVSGAFLIAIGLTDPHDEATLFGLIAAMAVFLEAGNGANFALVPHVHPFANGILSGLTGAAGNLGGVCFAILFRFHGKDYAASFWISGVMVIAMNVAVSWIRPVPKHQIGGR